MSALTDTPWDSAAFGMPAFELADASEASLKLALQTPGHHTVRVDPLAPKNLLHTYGFYYCDTLIEPFVTSSRLRAATHPDIGVKRDVEWAALYPLCHGAFLHGRFHRDFNLDPGRADLRYDNWLRQLHGQGRVVGLFWQDELAGFIAVVENRLVLHAVGRAHQGRGLSKYWWSLVTSRLLQEGHAEVTSSISAANMAVLNLYASLGFGFRNPQDIYHRRVE